METNMDVCCGCGAKAEAFPMVAVMREGEAFVSKPVCAPCHVDPAHRTVTLKATFFPRAAARVAVALAGSDTIRG